MRPARTGPSCGGRSGPRRGPAAEANAVSTHRSGGESLVNHTYPDPLGGSPGSVGDPVRRLFDDDPWRPAPRPRRRRAARRRPPTSIPQADDALLDRGEGRGQLTTIALPRTGATTARSLDASRPSTGLAVNELTPGAGSGEEIEAIKANKDNPGPQAPDVIDVGFPSAHRQDRWPDRSPTRSRPGTRSPTRPRTPTAPGRATTTACCRSR